MGLADVSTDIRLAPLTGSGYMLGDYLGVAPSTGPDVPAVPIWVDTRTGNPDPFITRVGLAPQLTFGSWRAARFSLSQINNSQQGSATADPDGDTVVNVLEYAFALNPRAGDAATATGHFSGTGPSATYMASYERVTGASDLLYSWVASTNLMNWSMAVPLSTTVATNSSRATEVVTATFAATNAHRFFRAGANIT